MAKMAGEWNALTRGAVTKQIGLLPYVFSADHNDLKLSEMFHLTLGLKFNTTFGVFFYLFFVFVLVFLKFCCCCFFKN